MELIVIPVSSLTANPVTFPSLPIELHIKIFKDLLPTDAVCLGLANKYFWEIFKGALPELYHIRFSVISNSTWQKPALKNSPYLLEPRVVFGFERPVFIIIKERHDEWVKL
jgi:hypothetical protein